VPQLREPDVLRLSQEGQLSGRTIWAGTPHQATFITPIQAGKQFRPYRWRERPRHPVQSPQSAQQFRYAGEAGSE
jgi:hypothetical protein